MRSILMTITVLLVPAGHLAAQTLPGDLQAAMKARAVGQQANDEQGWALLRS